VAVTRSVPALAGARPGGAHVERLALPIALPAGEHELVVLPGPRRCRALVDAAAGPRGIGPRRTSVLLGAQMHPVATASLGILLVGALAAVTTRRR